MARKKIFSLERGKWQKVYVRKGIRTPALKEDQNTQLLHTMEQGTTLESGALDHSAILTVDTFLNFAQNNQTVN